MHLTTLLLPLSPYVQLLQRLKQLSTNVCTRGVSSTTSTTFRYATSSRVNCNDMKFESSSRCTYRPSGKQLQLYSAAAQCSRVSPMPQFEMARVAATSGRLCADRAPRVSLQTDSCASDAPHSCFTSVPPFGKDACSISTCFVL
jgi:hypothetical protein